METCVSKTGEKGQCIWKILKIMDTIFNLKKHSKFKILSTNGKVWALQSLWIVIPHDMYIPDVL